MNLYEQIVDIDNIKQAYLEVVEKFELSSRVYRYHGIDGRNLTSYDFNSLALVSEIRDDLLSYTAITPALEKYIPKKNKPGKRPVYLHTLKERVRSQAVYRVVEPIFDSYFSEYLFSYRSGRPHYKAVKTVQKHYLEYGAKDNSYVLVGDISSYSDIINPEILKEMVRKVIDDSSVRRLIDLYIDMEYLDEFAVQQKSQHGIITGLPITVLFNNLYLDSFDREMGRKARLYRRVGDDFIAFGSLEKLEFLQKDMSEFLENIAISQKYQKIHIQKITESFSFLGYLFENEVISILPKSIKNMQSFFRRQLVYRPSLSLNQKKQRLKAMLYSGSTSFHYNFLQIIRQYNYINNQKQIQWIYDYFFRRLTIYFFGTYSPTYRKRLRKVLDDIEIPSLNKYYFMFHSKNKKLLDNYEPSRRTKYPL